jgi:hypothetical protein
MSCAVSYVLTSSRWTGQDSKSTKKVVRFVLVETSGACRSSELRGERKKRLSRMQETAVEAGGRWRKKKKDFGSLATAKHRPLPPSPSYDFHTGTYIQYSTHRAYKIRLHTVRSKAMCFFRYHSLPQPNLIIVNTTSIRAIKELTKRSKNPATVVAIG